jgi:hypothetical protein
MKVEPGELREKFVEEFADVFAGERAIPSLPQRFAVGGGWFLRTASVKIG